MPIIWLPASVSVLNAGKPLLLAQESGSAAVKLLSEMDRKFSAGKAPAVAAHAAGMDPTHATRLCQYGQCCYKIHTQAGESMA